jgi:hypothetical protein
VDDLRFVLLVARVALLDSEADVTGHASAPDLCLAAAHSESGCTVSVARVKDEERAKCDRCVLSLLLLVTRTAVLILERICVLILL